MAVVQISPLERGQQVRRWVVERIAAVLRPWGLKESVDVVSSALHEQVSERFDEQIVDIPSSTNGRPDHRRAHRAVPGHEVLEDIVGVARCIPRVVEQFTEVLAEHAVEVPAPLSLEERGGEVRPTRARATTDRQGNLWRPVLEVLEGIAEVARCVPQRIQRIVEQIVPQVVELVQSVEDLDPRPNLARATGLGDKR